MATKTKHYNAAEKRLIRNLALAITAADIEVQVVKPQTEKETGEPYQEKGGYLDIYFEKQPQAKRAWNALQREVSKVRKEYLAMED